MIKLNVILFLVNFLRTLFFIVIIYYLIKIVSKFLMPLFGAPPTQQKSSRPTQNRRPEGDVRIEKDQQFGSRTRRDEGEYVDFEEID